MSFYLLLLYLFLVVFRPHEYLEFLIGIPILMIVLGAGGLSWIASSNKISTSPQIKLMAILIFFMMFSITVNGWPSGALFYFSSMVPIFIMFVMMTSVLDSHEKIETTLKLLVVLVAIICIHGIDQKINGIGWTGAMLSQNVRITYLGIFNDPNDLALLMMMVFPFSCYLYLVSSKLIYKLFWLSIVLLIIYGLYLTQSRGGMLAFLGIVMGYFVIRKGVFYASIRIVVIVPVLGFLANRMFAIDPSEESASGRIEAWYEAIHLFISSPLYGVGPGEFTTYHHLTAHNSFFLVLAELGGAGYFLWLTFLLMSLLMSYRSVRYFILEEYDLPYYIKTKNKEFLISLSIFLSCLSFIVAAFFLSRSYNIILFMVCALCISSFNVNKKNYPSIVNKTIILNIMPYLMFSFVSIIGLYLLVNILLRLQ